MPLASLDPAGRCPLLNANAKDQGVLALMTAEHRKIDLLFDRLSGALTAPRMDPVLVTTVAADLFALMRRHAQIEQELVYPVIYEGIPDPSAILRAEIEHQSINELIGKIEQLDPWEPLYAAALAVLRGYLKQHVQAEETQLFPVAHHANVDLDSQLDRLLSRQLELDGEATGEPSEEEGDPVGAPSPATVANERIRELGARPQE